MSSTTIHARASQPHSMVRRPPFVLRALRARPHLYSAVCKARLLYSRRLAGAAERRLYRRKARLFGTSALEAQQVALLRHQGFALLPGYFPDAIADRICAQSDAMFRGLEIDAARAYTVQTGQRQNLDGLSYDELAASEKVIALRDPLVHIPELFSIAFNETILRIAANFLGCVPPLYRVTLVRDFPHDRPLHSSNFHKDTDECDSLQIFIYLVDIDDSRGPLVYVPGSNHYDARSCRPRLARDLGVDANDGRISDEEVERIYPRDSWAILRTPRGSIAFIHGNGLHKGPAWPHPGDPGNQPRTAIKLDLHGHKSGVARDLKENRIPAADFRGMSELQRLFAHATLIES